MAKALWALTSPSSGSGTGTVNVEGATHTGRSQRQTSLTFKASGVADVARAVTQEAKPEFVQIDNISVGKEGGTITVTGKSNSSKLNFLLGAGDIVELLPDNYSAGGASTDNNTAITGDPGATAEYNFSIQLTADDNETIEARTQTLTVTANGGQSAQATISQAEGDPILEVSPESITLTAEGTAVAVTVTSNTNWTVE
jgi:ketosteroid isomerase-like protein